MGRDLKSMRGRRGATPRFSTAKRIERPRARLAVERDPKAIATIEAQLRAFERPPRGTYD